MNQKDPHHDDDQTPDTPEPSQGFDPRPGTPNERRQDPRVDDHDHGHAHAHSHGHTHDHSDPFHVHPGEELDESTLDPANRSLAEALRISFNLLKFVALILVILFVVVGGYRQIEQNQVGIHFRFGAPMGEWVEQPLGDWLVEQLRFDRQVLQAALSMDRIVDDGRLELRGPAGPATISFTRISGGDDQTTRLLMSVQLTADRQVRRTVVVRQAEERAVVTVERGRLVVDVMEDGLHFTLPSPIDEVVVIPTRPQTVDIAPRNVVVGDQVRIEPAFWFTPRPSEVGRPLEQQTPQRGGLVPGRDGSLVTADRNLVHGQWSAEYRILPADAGLFARNIGGDDITDSLRRAERIVRQAVESAILHVVAQTPVEVFIAGNADKQKMRAIAQAKLDAAETGITLVRVTQDVGIPPLAVRAAFNAVTEAQSARTQALQEARQEAGSLLQTAAGSGYPAMILAVDYYETARRMEDEQMIQRAERVLTDLLSEVPVAEALQPLVGSQYVDQQRLTAAMVPVPVQGAVVDVIQQATTERTNLVARVQAEADAFLSQWQQYEGDPQLRRIIMDRMWQDMMEEVLTNADEIFYLPDDLRELRMDIPRNPDVRGAAAARQQLEAMQAGREETE